MREEKIMGCPKCKSPLFNKEDLMKEIEWQSDNGTFDGKRIVLPCFKCNKDYYLSVNKRSGKWRIGK